MNSPRGRIGHGILLLTACLITNCKADDVQERATTVQLRQVQQAYEHEIASIVYDANYDVPQGFFTDERADTPGSYSIHHVKDESVSYELCANNATDAAAMEQEENDARAVSGELSGTNENYQYFEFVRELNYADSVGNVPGPTSPGFSRIFKCAFVDRVGVDRNLRDGYGGKLNALPLDEDTVRNFVEYLWQFTFFWPAQKTVIASRIDESGESYRHTLTIAFVYNKGFQKCDLVEIVDWIFTTAKDDGAIWRAFVPVHEFESEYANGTVRICTDG